MTPSLVVITRIVIQEGLLQEYVFASLSVYPNMEINIDMNIGEDEFKRAIAEQMDEVVKEYLETKAQKGHFECPSCDNDVFDIETWEAQDDIRAAGVCRNCNERMPIDVDTSEIDALT